MANNGKQPPTEDLHFERTPAKCGRCKRPFGDFYFEVINDLVQLRCGNALILRAELTCLHCGSMFSWTIRDRDIEGMATSYKKLLGLIKPYAPE